MRIATLCNYQGKNFRNSANRAHTGHIDVASLRSLRAVVLLRTPRIELLYISEAEANIPCAFSSDSSQLRLSVNASLSLASATCRFLFLDLFSEPCDFDN